MERVAIVTGGTRGIGKAISIALADRGYHVAATYFGNRQAAEEFNRTTGIAAYQWDVANFEACECGVAQVVRDMGPIDILVNNAGITRDTLFHKMSPEQWEQVISTNLGGLFNMTRQVWTGMRERRFGRIVSISSINGQKGQAGQVNYAAAKAGELGFTKALAQEGATKGITVNAVCPGYTRTEMVEAISEKVMTERILPEIPLGRLAEPEEIARCVEFLVSEKAGFITGSTTTVNGGQYMT